MTALFPLKCTRKPFLCSRYLLFLHVYFPFSLPLKQQFYFHMQCVHLQGSLTFLQTPRVVRSPQPGQWKHSIPPVTVIDSAMDCFPRQTNKSRTFAGTPERTKIAEITKQVNQQGGGSLKCREKRACL